VCWYGFVLVDEEEEEEEEEGVEVVGVGSIR
jgi:hypothetical protein